MPNAWPSDNTRMLKHSVKSPYKWCWDQVEDVFSGFMGVLEENDGDLLARWMGSYLLCKQESFVRVTGQTFNDYVGFWKRMLVYLIQTTNVQPNPNFERFNVQQQSALRNLHTAAFEQNAAAFRAATVDAFETLICQKLGGIGGDSVSPVLHAQTFFPMIQSLLKQF